MLRLQRDKIIWLARLSETRLHYTDFINAFRMRTKRPRSKSAVLNDNKLSAVRKHGRLIGNLRSSRHLTSDSTERALHKRKLRKTLKPKLRCRAGRTISVWRVCNLFQILAKSLLQFSTSSNYKLRLHRWRLLTLSRTRTRLSTFLDTTNGYHGRFNQKRSTSAELR